MPTKITKNHDRPHIRKKQEKLDKILLVLRKHPEGLFPKFIASYAGLNHSTVRSYLREMTRRAEVENKAGIYSVVDSAHRGNFKPLPMMQNYVLQVLIPKDFELSSIDKNIDLGICRMRLTVGKTSRKATGQVSANPPITVREAFCTCLIFQDKVFEAVGFKPDVKDIKILTSEFNLDEYGIRLDGVNCITAKTLTAIEKLYNKEDCVRHEVKLLQPITPEALMGLLDKGVTYGHLFQMASQQNERIQRLERSILSLNGNIRDLSGLMRKILEKLDEKSPYSHAGGK